MRTAFLAPAAASGRPSEAARETIRGALHAAQHTREGGREARETIGEPRIDRRGGHSLGFTGF